MLAPSKRLKTTNERLLIYFYAVVKQITLNKINSQECSNLTKIP